MAKVRITVLDEMGAVVEQGEAVHAEGDNWQFPSHPKGSTIITEAWDLAANRIKFVS